MGGFRITGFQLRNRILQVRSTRAFGLIVSVAKTFHSYQLVNKFTCLAGSAKWIVRWKLRTAWRPLNNAV